MRIRDYVERDWILVNLAPADKPALLEMLADEIAARVPMAGRVEILRRLQEREYQASTGVGNGVAIPHATLDALERVFLLFAVIPNGVAYDAIDHQPVYFVCVLLGPSGSIGDHLKLLARIARLIRREALIEDLRQATDAEQVYRLIVQEDERHVE